MKIVRYPVLATVAACALIAATTGNAGASLERASWCQKTERSGNSVASVAAEEVKRAAWMETRPTSFADLAERVQASVVNISTTKKMRQPQFMTPFPRFGPRDPFDDFFEKFFEGMPAERTQKSLGSGFIVSKDGAILTNNHVVSQADEIQVGLSDGRKFKAKVIGRDERTDIAVIKIEGDGDLPVAQLGDSDKIRPGDWVMAIGNPFGLEHTVTVGVISAMGRLLGGGPFAKFIQTDASINPGNSGGPLFNIGGEVIGVNTMIFAGGQGIGFAIPISLAKDLMPQLITKGSVTRGWLGVSIQEITPELAKSFKLKGEKGALIAEVFQGSPADKAGVKRGDVVMEFNGKPVESPYDLSLMVGNMKVGTSVVMKILREEKELDLTVDIGEADGENAAGSAGVPPKADSGNADVLGLVVRQISPHEASRLDLPADYRGVVIERVEPGSSSEQSDVRGGDVLLELNGIRIETAQDYQRASEKVKKGDYVRLLIRRGSASIYLAFKVS